MSRHRRCHLLGHAVDINRCLRCGTNFGGKRLIWKRWVR